MQRGAFPLCGSLCDLCASVMSVFVRIFTTESGEPQSSHRESVNPTRADYFFSSLLGKTPFAVLVVGSAIPRLQLSTAVRAAVAQKFKGYKVIETQTVRRWDETRLIYEVHILPSFGILYVSKLERSLSRCSSG